MEFEKHVKIRREKFGAVVFETLREKVFVANETGSEILCLLEKGEGPVEMSAELKKKYDCDLDIIKNDVEEFISMLKDKKIIKNEEQKR